jgi:Mrp family chromosome partitioning ATPase
MKNIAAMMPEKSNDEETVEPRTSKTRTTFKIHPEQVVSAKINRTLPPVKILALLHAIEKNMAAVSRTPTVLFMGPHKGAGADVVAFEAAYASALSGKRVLFIDTNGSTSEIIRKLRGKISVPLNIPLTGDVESFSSFVNLEGTSLFFATFKEYEEAHTSFPDSSTHKNIIDELRDIFDLIVVYSESGLSNPLATILSGLADASIIVAEEGRTRIPIIKDLRRLIDMHGGHVAGIVMNKCQSHIPRFIYATLFGR